jgi:O-antigen/teichoic acid export membrane protein
MVQSLNTFIFVFLIFVSSIFYCFANFYSKIPGIKDNFLKILFISLFFVLVEYLFKIPAIYYYGKEINSILSYSIIMVSIFISLVFFSKYILKEEIPMITYISVLLIIIILIAHNYILEKNKIKK